MKRLIHKKYFNFFNQDFYNSKDYKKLVKYVNRYSRDDVLNIPHEFVEYETSIMEYVFNELDLSDEYHQYLYGIVHCNRVERHTDAASYKHTILFIMQVDKESYVFVEDNICENMQKGDIIYLNNEIGHGLDGSGGKPFIAIAFDFPYKVTIDILDRLKLWKKNMKKSQLFSV